MSRITSVLIAVVFILTAQFAFTAGRSEQQVSLNVMPAEAEAEEPELPPPPPAPSRTELTMRALAMAYPKRIDKVEFRNDDWAVLMDEVWYYYAGGVMLPEELLEKAGEYTGSFGLTSYRAELPPWTDPTPEENERYRARYNPSPAQPNTNTANNAARVQRQRSYHFRDALWGASSSATASRRMTTIKFLGFNLPIHSYLVETLALVEERIQNAAKTDPQVQAWITGLGEIHGWNWRNVANSQNRSNHSYGIAIDILPKSLGGKETYWQWAAQNGKEWWNVPYTDRYHPPDAVIKAFEAYGFMWGGKWPSYDTMHFEFRPEAFILSGLDITVLQ